MKKTQPFRLSAENLKLLFSRRVLDIWLQVGSGFETGTPKSDFRVIVQVYLLSMFSYLNEKNEEKKRSCELCRTFYA